MKRTIYRLLFFCLLLVSFSNVKATDERYAAAELRGNQLAPDSTSMVMDTVYFNPGLKPLQTTFFVRNLITFKVDESYRSVIPDEFSVQIKFVVHYVRDDNGTPVPEVSDEKTLTVEYSKFTAYDSKMVYIDRDWYKAEVEITEITATNGNLSDFRDALVLTNEILVSREYNFTCTDNSIKNIFTNTTTVNTKGELNVYWQPERAADEYDLEWTYIDDLALPNYQVGSGYNIKKIFANNATRVSISRENYNIPLLYEASGHLFCRVRAVQVKPGGQRVESVWSSDYTAGLGSYSFIGHDSSLNWQATTSFAEEGKRKSVVQYYDGSLKSRQTVTKDNTTDTTVIAETLYDHQGRPVIQVMPTPSLSSIIKYTPGFNTLNGAEYRKDEYDGVLQDTCYCQVGAPPMDTTSGAANYYSPANPLSANGYHKYIPNAKGFVFAETQYIPDNTGRISAQGAVGETFRIGNKHTTNYTYAAADQEELDALFGTEVGNNSHYFKNTVRDANGQINISYVDMHGRTIATALAGKPAALLDTLESNKSNLVVKKLLDSNSNVIKGTEIESSKGLQVTKAGQHRFVYSLLPDSISIKTCDAKDICYDCIYDLKITITEDCNDSSQAGQEPIVITRTNYKLDTNCNTITNFPAVDTTVYLYQGSYVVTKTLTVNKKAMDYYLNDVFLVRNTCHTLEQTIEEQQTLMASRLSCQPVEELSADESIRQQMLADVTPPYGQYANPNNVDNASVFWPLPILHQNWQVVTGTYIDENGVPENPDPRTLTAVDFSAAFKDSWAETLLQLHPEYNKLVKYTELAESNAWDKQFGSTETFQEAVSKGYLNPGSFATHPAGANFNDNTTYSDPLFTTLIAQGKVDPSYKSMMQDSLLHKARDNSGNDISIWSLATMVTLCSSTDAACALQYTPLDNAFSINAGCSGDLDVAWKNFREMYLQKKRDIMAVILRVAEAGSYNLTSVAQNHHLNFYDPTLITFNTLPGDVQTGRDSLNSYISQNCQAYATQWMSDLGGCYDSADLAVIIPQLVQVCKEGGDENHLMGASTVKPGSTSPYKSFEEVLKAYDASRYNSNCNVYLISGPAPYDQQPVYTNKPVFQKPDDCECTTINELYNKYQAVEKDSSFAAYLFRTTGTKMSQADLDILRMACKGQINCNYLSTPVYLPPALQCGAKDVCVDCNQVDSLFSSYSKQFPDAMPRTEGTDSLQQVSNRLFEQFMNTNLGFSKTTSEYLSFMDACNIKHTVACGDDSLGIILNQFNALYKNNSTHTPGGQYHGDTTDLGIYGDGYPVSLGESIQNGILTFPPRIQSNPGPITYYYGKPLRIPDNGLSIEVRMKMPLLDPTNCNYPDFQFQLRPQGGWVNALFFNRSVSGGCTTKAGAFDLADSTHPGHIITSQPQMAIDMTDWVKIKMTIRDNKYQIYVADTFLMEVPYTGTLTQLNSIGLFYGTRTSLTKARPAIDYIRVYNGCDELMMNQEYNSITDTVCPDLSIRVAPDDYKTVFASYYNRIRGTNFTSAQVDAIYANSCNGLQLNTCNNINCDQLKDVLKAYNSKRLADSSHFSRYKIVPDSLFTYSRSDIYKNGYAHIPDQYVNTVDWGGSYYKNDTICTGNVFTAVTRIKKPARDTRMTNFNFQIHFNDDYRLENVGPIFYLLPQNPTAADTAGMLSGSGMIGYGREGNYTPPANPFISDYSDWVEIKVTHGNDNIFRVYYNGVFVSQRYVAMPVTRLIGFAALFEGKANNGYVDYFKVYDENNKLQYVEEFEDALQSPSNDPAAFRCTDSCQAKFTKFYNQYTHSSKTYAQIQQLYSNCGQTLDGCSYGNNTDSLLSWYNTYKKNGHTPHLDASGADTTNYKVDFGGWVYTAGVPLGEVIKNGVLTLPKYYADTLKRNLVDFDYINDTICIDTTGFTWETRLKLPDSLIASNSFGASWWLWLYGENPDPGQFLMAISKQDGKGVAICTHNNDPKKSCADVNVPGVHMDDWRVVKFVFRGRDFKYYIDNTLQAQRTLDAPLTKLHGWSFTSYSKYGQVDYVRIYKPDSAMIFDEEFNDPRNLATHDDEASRCSKCGEGFAQYYNQRNGSELPVSVIDSIYYAALHFHINDCYEPSPTLCGKSEPVFTTAPWEQPAPCADSTLFGTSTGVLIHEAYRDSLLNSFTDRYLAKCLSARYHENFTLYQEISEFHYTLYYYDQAGTLQKTVPPAGVDVSKLGWARAWSDSVTIARRNKQKLVPNHTLPTQYRYNTLNQVVAQQSPDGGMSEFWYDRLGRLAISRNARQKGAGANEDNRLYSYTRYDSLGRITEVGQVSNTAANGAMTEVVSRNQPALDNWLANLQNRRGQITNTVYDLPYTGFAGLSDTRQIITQQNLRNRVSYTTLTDTGTSNAYSQGTFYTYDILGNVAYLLQDYGSSSFAATANVMNKNDNRWKKVGYQYDLISGKVNMVMYQQGWSDGLYHRFSYDAENRLVLAETSRDSLVWDKDARYEYYRHGPLARVTLGDQQVQGLDYAYTLQGWLKGINSTGGTDGFDMGGDGHTGSLAQYTARDAFGLTLNYFGNDYAAVNGQPFPGYSAFLPAGAYRPLYNGNISSSSVYQKKFDYANSPGGPLVFYNYKYDQLNRLTAQDTYNGFLADQNKWDNMSSMGETAKERVAYDANGNIQKYLRKSIQGGVMDSLNYYYYANTNRLKFITDNVPASGYDGGPDHLITDIDGQADNNYTYDAIGNLIADNAEKITSIKWNVYGKIQEIIRTAAANAPATDIKYSYDATGNRISQVVTSGGTKHYTWYVRDAQGNMLSTYTADGNATNLASLQLNQAEKFLYGSSRLGLITVKETVDGGPDYTQDYYYDGRAFAFGRGQKQYELTNHLGNVLATISDRKFGVALAGSSLIDHYEPDIVTAQDYYPFGMLSREALPGSGVPYKFGFNGKLNDNDVKGGLGLQQDYGMRIYDNRVGRFLSVDPITRQYPQLTPYQFASNRPIDGIDLDGLEFVGTLKEQQGYGLFKLQQYLKKVPSPSRDMLHAMEYTNNPANQQILTRDFYGQTIIGKRSDVEYHNEIQRLQHNEAVGENISNGLGGAVGYWFGGDRGSYIGAAFDQAIFAYSAVPGEGYLSKPNTSKLVGYKPTYYETDVIPENMAIVYRTQGGVPPNASEHRVRFDKNRNIIIEGDEMMYVTINDKDHQVYFYEKRGGVDKGAYIVSFKIPASLFEEIKTKAVRQREMPNNPGSPQISDPTKSVSAYGLPKEYIDKLRNQAIPGSGKVETPIKN